MGDVAPDAERRIVNAEGVKEAGAGIADIAEIIGRHDDLAGILDEVLQDRRKAAHHMPALSAGGNGRRMANDKLAPIACVVTPAGQADAGNAALRIRAHIHRAALALPDDGVEQIEKIFLRLRRQCGKRLGQGGLFQPGPLALDLGRRGFEPHQPLGGWIGDQKPKA